MSRNFILWLSISALLTGIVIAQQPQPTPPNQVAGIPVNYDEAKIASYTLPDPLKTAKGKQVRDAKTWLQKRRPEIVRLYEENQFGRAPGRPGGMSFNVFDKGTAVFEGQALRKQVTIYFTPNKSGPKMEVLIYLPPQATKPVPLFFQLSFTANSNAVDDAGIQPGEIWNRDKRRVPAVKDGRFGNLKLLPFIEKGFGVATLYYGDIDPDFAGGIQHGVRALYLKKEQTEPASNEWGTISAWAWGASRALDYFETDKAIDAKRVALFGVSRLGKTVLWAGARDERFAMVIASCSGEGGAALSRRNYGETIGHLVAPSRYPYQFAGNYAKYGERVNEFPIDAHMLVSLIAPRPLLLQTGDKDYWSDPKGEFLAAVAAAPVYKLFGKQALDTETMPAAGDPIFHTLGFVMHAGGHGTIPSDYDLFLQFMQRHFQPAN